MIGSRLGPYSIEKELGSGGMGVVYLADVVEDVREVPPGSQVAVKVVHAHLLERRGFFKRFMREADIGRTVRHAAVVRTFDVDAISVNGKNIHFMVMEYVEGRTLRDILAEMRIVPETLLREVARQVASGLAAIHEAGIVHRDLKPENVLVTPDHQVKIMDLGVARLMEESVALTREGQFTGSLLYASPEQFGGNQEVGPPADLYSVGVMLYELACGSNPFHRDGAAAVLTAHLKEVPPALSERNSEVSGFLSEVVGTLLRKDPAERIPTAAALFALLEEGEKSSWWKEREKRILREEGHLPKIPIRRETRLHGRDEEYGLLCEAWGGAAGGKGGMVLLEGEAGIGKTRLVDAFLQTLRSHDAHVLYGNYSPSGGLGALTDALTARFGTAGMEDSLEPYMRVTPRLVPAFAALVQHRIPPAGSESLSIEGMHAVFVNLMKAMAEEKPLLWIVEDLHFAPPESRKVVLSLARAVEGNRVLLLATARQGIPEDEVANFSRLGAFRKVSLARLPRKVVVDLLKEALRSSTLAERLGGKIADKSDGVPYFVFEMLRGLQEGNYIRKKADGSYIETQIVTEIEIPSSVRDLIDARLRSLSREERALLDVGAVQGMEFDPELVSMVLDLKVMRVLQDLAEIERRTGVVVGGGDTYRFDQRHIHDVVMGAMMGRLLREYHASLAAAFLEREGLAEADPRNLTGPQAIFLANHFLRGSRPAEGAPFLLPAVDHLLAAHREEEALALLDRALGPGGRMGGAERMEALLKVGPLRRNLGRPEEGEAALEEAVTLADGAGEAIPRARARRALATFLTEAGRGQEAMEFLQQALPMAREGEDPLEEGQLETSLGLCLWRLGRGSEGRVRLEKALEIHRKAGDGAGEARAMGGLGAVLGEGGLHAEARAYKERALEMARAAGNRRDEARQTGNLGEDDRAAGMYGAAMERYATACALARETGFRALEAVSLHNLGETLNTLGDIPEAGARLEASISLSREIGHLHSHVVTLRAQGDRALLMDLREEALTRYREAMAKAHEIGAATLEAEALVGLGRLHLLEGRAAKAGARLEEAAGVARRAEEWNTLALATCLRAAMKGGDPGAAAKVLEEIGDRPWLVARMEARWWLWKAGGDRSHLEEAWRLLVHLREHAPLEYRDPMVEKVPLHRDIAAAAREACL